VHLLVQHLQQLLVGKPPQSELLVEGPDGDHPQMRDLDDAEDRPSDRYVSKHIGQGFT